MSTNQTLESKRIDPSQWEGKRNRNILVIQSSAASEWTIHDNLESHFSIYFEPFLDNGLSMSVDSRFHIVFFDTELTRENTLQAVHYLRSIRDGEISIGVILSRPQDLSVEVLAKADLVAQRPLDYDKLSRTLYSLPDRTRRAKGSNRSNKVFVRFIPPQIGSDHEGPTCQSTA